MKLLALPCDLLMQLGNLAHQQLSGATSLLGSRSLWLESCKLLF